MAAANFPSFAPFSSSLPELTGHVLSFLEPQDLRIVDSVSQLFRWAVAGICEERCRNEWFIPESLPPKVTLKQLILNQFPNAIRVDFFREYFGEVDMVPPIPRRFIEMAPRPGFKLVLIPEYITMSVGPNSPLMLDETIAVGGKKARLIEDPERAPQGEAREIRVPVTPNNYIMLAQTCLKKNLPSQFGGRSKYSCRNVLDQNGDVGVGPSHWSYQKKDVIGFGKPYHSQPDGEKGQVEIAKDEGLEIVPLGDRIVFRLSSHIKSGKIPRSGHFERTSTVVHDGRLHQASIFWGVDGVFGGVDGPVFRPSFGAICDCDEVGVAAQVPAGSSQAIGH